MKLRRMLFFCCMSGLVIWAISMLYPSYTNYQQAKKDVYNLEQKILEQQKEKETLLAKTYSLKINPRAVERVARDKFGWSRPGEKIYDFSN